jgi:hypothetical protein
MKLGSRIVVLWVVLWAVAWAHGQTPNTGALMTRELALTKAVDEVKDRRKAALGDLPQQQSAAGSELSKARADTTLSDADKAAKVAQLETQLNKIRDQVRALSKPFDDEMKALTAKAGPDKEVFDLIARHLRELGPPYSVKPGTVSGVRSDGFYACHFEDAQGENQVWTHIRLEQTPELKNSDGLLDGKYPISSLGTVSIWFKVGYFKIVVHANNKEWQSKETVQALAKAMFDLEGLASLKPQ